MNIISISHKTATVPIRERFAFSREEQVEFLTIIKETGHIQECVLLSTCNRTEVYYHGDSKSTQVMQQSLAVFKKVELELLLKYFMVYQEEKAINHLFYVTCGMDSMVIGEDEILGQVKDAYELARGLGLTKYFLNTLFQAAVTCAKRIKTDTKLSKTPVSIGTLVSNEIFHFEKSSKKVLIIGLTGKMGTIIMKNIYNKPNIEIIGTTRRHNGAGMSLPNYQKVTMVDYQDRYQYMNDADIIISATTSPHYTITYHELAESLTIKKERLFIDLAVPMDMDKNITKIPYARIYDIDYFDTASKNNALVKEQETSRAQDMIDEHLSEVKKELYFHDFIVDIPKLKQVFHEKTLESILYEMRDTANAEELASVLHLFRKLI